MRDNMKLSLVVPCYNEADNIELFYQKVEDTFHKESFSYEYIFVNDGSKDQTYENLKKLTKMHPDANINVVNFSRNFGKESAMYAGMKESIGEYTAIIDADLQQDPAYVLQMMQILDNDDNLDSVAAFQEKRREGKVLRAFKSAFYHLINKVSQVEFVDGASDFRLLRRPMVDAILDMPENNRFSKGIFSWVGFRTYYMAYDVQDRANGQSSWSFWKLFKYAIEGFVSFTTMPLRIATFFGITFSFLAFVYLAVVLIQKLVLGIHIPGYATTICLILLIGGIQLFCLGIMGEYLARTYMETKRRPIFVQRNKIDYKERKKQH